MEDSDCSHEIAPAPTLHSACSCACCCESGSAAQRGDHQHCSNSSSSSPPYSCGCTCGSACGHSGTQPDADQEELLKQVNSVFSAAEAALQAFWRASIARVVMNSESAGSEAAYSQVKTAARSQAAASIAWVLAAASVVLKEDMDEDQGDDASTNFQYQGSAGQHYQYPEFYPMHRQYNAAPGNMQNIIRRPNAQLRTSNMQYGAAGRSYYKSNMHTAARSLPRWEWRPVRNSHTSSYTSNSGMSSPPCAFSTSAPCNKPPSCSSAMSAGTATSAPPDHHPCGVPSITISSLLPPLINCRISNTPYNQETLNDAYKVEPTTNHSSRSTDETLNDDKVKPKIGNSSQSTDETLIMHESCTKAWSTPPHIENDNIAIDILDSQVVTKTLVEPFHVDKETLEEPLKIHRGIDEDEEKEKNVLIDLTQDSPTHLWGGDDTFSFINCSTPNDFDNDCKPLRQDTELSSINTLQGGRNHKKHLKKKQRKASNPHL